MLLPSPTLVRKKVGVPFGAMTIGGTSGDGCAWARAGRLLRKIQITIGRAVFMAVFMAAFLMLQFVENECISTLIQNFPFNLSSL